MKVYWISYNRLRETHHRIQRVFMLRLSPLIIEIEIEQGMSLMVALAQVQVRNSIFMRRGGSNQQTRMRVAVIPSTPRTR